MADLLDSVDEVRRKWDPRPDSEIRLAVARRIPELPFLLDYLTRLDLAGRPTADRHERGAG